MSELQKINDVMLLDFVEMSGTLPAHKLRPRRRLPDSRSRPSPDTRPLSPTLRRRVPCPPLRLPSISGQEVKTFQIGPQSLNGLVYVPEGYAASQEKWPLMMLLHGARQKGTGTEKLKKNGPILLVTQGTKFPLIIAAPKCPTDGYWSKPEQVNQLKDVLDSLLHDYRIDGSRIYLTGLSMGAHGVWSFAAIYPDLFAAIAPIAGGGECSQADRLEKMPIWAFHGDADDKVPFKQTEDMVAALKKAGAAENLRFTVYPGVKHDS